MSAPMFVLSLGASLGVGAVGAQVLGGVLSKPITGEVVPSRITDLAGYLTASGAKGLGFEDFDSETSVGLPAGIDIPTAPTVNAPKPGINSPPLPVTANADKKRMLAAASFGGGLAIAVLAFLLIRRVTA